MSSRIDYVLDDIGRAIGVKFAPVNVPMHRRRQTFAVALMYSLQPLFVLLSIYILLFNRGLPLNLFLLYLGWMIFIDKRPGTGGSICMAYRKLFLWRWFGEYFPVSIIKTADLDPTKNYVFGYHPHGIIGTGAVVNFATEASNFSQMFPGIKMHVLTLASNLKIPIFREHIMLLGMSDANGSTCRNILTSGQGQSIMLVIGGAAEALDAHPGTYSLTLKSRKGFVKIALQTGSHLVPVFSFGENDLFQQISNDQGTLLRRIQKVLQKYMGFSIPLFHGRGVFNYTFGLMPYRSAIQSVVGKAIPVPKIENPTQEDIDQYHGIYVQALRKIWDDHKGNHAKSRSSSFSLK